MHGLAAKVVRHDRDLAQRMQRAGMSAALNGSAGVGGKAGTRRSRLEDAVNSERETVMALRLSAAYSSLKPQTTRARQGCQSGCSRLSPGMSMQTERVGLS